MKNHNQYNSGIADVWYSGRKDFWIEYKFIKIPARPQTIIDLTEGKKPEISHLQQEWLTARHAEGRNVGVIVGCKEGGVWFPGISWNTPIDAAAFRSRVMPRPEVGKLIVLLTGDQTMLR